MPYDVENAENAEDVENVGDTKKKTNSNSPSSLVSPITAVGLTAALSACGGGGASDSGGTVPSGPQPDPDKQKITDEQAARFLLQASMGVTRTQIQRVQSLGYSAWIDEQFSTQGNGSRWDWLVGKGLDVATYKNSQAGFDPCAWRKLISSPDTLRQRMTLALSEILVVAIQGLVNGGGWKGFAAANYLDLLEDNCFGNYRDILQKISTSTTMSLYLTYRGNTRFNPQTGAMPDENYAREIMQLFTIGLLQLNQDGTPVLVNGNNIETYTLDDITGLARVFTGWDFDLTLSNTSTPDYHRRPLKQVPLKHETGSASFLGFTIPAGVSGENALTMALDFLFAHQNVAPFISKQLIQRLITSNPTPAYVARVAAVFNNNGKGIKGDMKAVIKAILLDDEARSAVAPSDTTRGKIREPMLRFLAWARSFNANSASDTWLIGDTSDAGSKLGQSPLRSPTVFNFFRPGYVPPNTAIANAGLVAPEMQLVSESSVVGYVNFMQTVVSGGRGFGDLKADYSGLLPLADNANSLVAEINLLLAANQISASNLAVISNAVASLHTGTDVQRLQRIYAAITLILACPEFIVLK
ncbi:DUF1800 domain-containing protein [Undibacterium cyanobacteriorum]|uniref:DUF1800 domain-containing protein n=1 Tax=Undibacterium cyanobacteriorum TaxID=3073561 RepID=A0ABY9RIK7_9BURK|nr:DUF1800 domain-containing protein [Undibacterium sp. 20NA77.5]WMW81053.1 DUF1800 domain-containing protein [Undibacterium sp. 20NA77.5]